MPRITGLALTLLLGGTAAGAAQSTLYRAEFVQAAPGRLLELIDAYRGRMPAYDAAQEPRPILMRHSQGDQWDLLLLVPLGDRAFFSPEHGWNGSGTSRVEFDHKLRELVAWREELYVRGPSLDDVNRDFATAGFAHIEIFQALPGAYDQLRHERDMENAFNRATGRSRLLVFTRDPDLGGAPWDLFTIDLYRDLMHYAQSTVVPAAVADSAARAAGFSGQADIGPTLRRYIAKHHDTLAGVVR